MFKHCYMPQSMINSVIVSLVKNKSGDLTDKNNYRPIALSSIASKVFEHIIILRLEEYLWTNDNHLDLNQAIQQIFVFMLYQNSSSILKAVLLLYMLHSLMQVRLSIKSVIGFFFEN